MTVGLPRVSYMQTLAPARVRIDRVKIKRPYLNAAIAAAFAIMSGIAAMLLAKHLGIGETLTYQDRQVLPYIGLSLCLSSVLSFIIRGPRISLVGGILQGSAATFAIAFLAALVV